MPENRVESARGVQDRAERGGCVEVGAEPAEVGVRVDTRESNISCHIRYQCSIAVNKKMCEGFDKNFYKNIERFVKIEN